MKNIFMIFVLVGFSTIGLSQTSIDRRLFPVDIGDKCGYINIKGELKISPAFDFCMSFNEGMAGVSLTKKSGYIDESGQIVIPLQFDSSFPYSFYEGFAPILVDKTRTTFDVGYVDKSGKVTILSNFSEVGYFCEGLAAVKKNGKSGYIDKNMKIVIPLKYDYAVSFSEGIALVTEKYGSGKDYYIDKSGRKVIENYGADGSYFSEGLAKFHLKDTRYGYRYGFMDTKGKVVIKPQYGYRCLFKEG